VVTTLPATGVSSAGATLNGTIDDKGHPVSYTLDWQATFPNSCADSIISGEFTGNLRGLNGPQQVSALLAEPLPARSRVTYRLVAGTTTGFEISSAGSQSVTYGTILPDSGAGAAFVQSSTSAVIAAVITGFTEQNLDPQYPVIPLGTDAHGGLQFTGTGTQEYGLLQFWSGSEAAGSTIVDPSSTEIGGSCGTYVETTLTGLVPDTVYNFAPVQAYGLGACPVELSSSVVGGLAAVTNVDQFEGQNYCWDGNATTLATYLQGEFGDTSLSVNGTYYYPFPPVFAGAVGPLLDPAALGATPAVVQAYGPMVGAARSFQTGSTTAPSGTGLNSSTGTGDDSLGCSASGTCDGTQTFEYQTSTPSGARDLPARDLPARDAAASLRSTTVVLASTRFTIAAHHRKTIHFHISRSGLRFLRAHGKIVAVTLVTVERVGKGKPVTITNLVRLTSSKAKRRT
jgi:hypothetical protein